MSLDSLLDGKTIAMGALASLVGYVMALLIYRPKLTLWRQSSSR
jgi:hypothetical protein